MMIFAAIYFYFLIQMIMTWKWKDFLTAQKMKETLNWVPSTVKEKTKVAKKKLENGSDSIKKWVKNITEKTSNNLQKWKDFVVETYKYIKSKITSINTKKNKNVTGFSENNLVSELEKSNKEIIGLVSNLVNKYDESLKILEEINKNLSKKK